MTKCPFCDRKELKPVGKEYHCGNCGYIVTQEVTETLFNNFSEAKEKTTDKKKGK
jgi:ribosomal protein L37AE/L43A